MGIGIESEKGLADPERPGFLALAVSPHVPLAIAADTMRIDRQKFANEIPRGPADASQGNLQSLGVSHRVGTEQLVDGQIAGHERQPVGQLESSLAQRTPSPYAGATQRGFMDQLECQSRLNLLRRLAAPSAQQVPSSHPQMLRNQKPQANQVARDFVGQELSHAAL